MSDGRIKHLVRSEGKVRILEMVDGSVVEREGGSVSWRNNNPGNLKFSYSGSADKTVDSVRSKEQALADAQKRYQGVVGLDQWGNAVFESYEAGRAAKIQLLERKYGDMTVDSMVRSYSVSDYSGKTNHDAQLNFIYSEGSRQGVGLRGKLIGSMDAAELNALADGIKGFEGWKVGATHAVRPAQVGTVSEPVRPSAGPQDITIYAAARAHFFEQGRSYEYGRSDHPKPGRDPSRLERDLDGDGRLGVDCSAFVWRALKDAGYGVPGENAAGFTTHSLFVGNTVTQFAAKNFDVIPAEEARQSRGSLQPGDLLMFSSKGGQHIAIFKGYDEKGNIQFIGSQGSTGPSEVTIVPHGYWDGAATHIVGALRAKPEFRTHTPSVQISNHQAVSAGVKVDTEVQFGSKGVQVHAVQQKLSALGYNDASGRPLRIDSDFGTRTEEAVKAFQLAHGLQVDGVVGYDTRNALAKSERLPLLSERTHPDNPMFQQARHGLKDMPGSPFRSEAELDRTAAAMVSAARQAGISRIDHVVMNTHGNGVIAVQGDLRDPAKNFVSIDKAQAASQSLEQSTSQLAQHLAHREQGAQVQAQMQNVEHRAGLSLGMRP